MSDDKALILDLAQHCPDCKEALERATDKLYYCRACCNFAIELDGTIQSYLLDPPESQRLHRDVRVPSAIAE